MNKNPMCAYCRYLTEHIDLLQNKLNLLKDEKRNTVADLEEIKCSYWLLKEYCSFLKNDCTCDLPEKLMYTTDKFYDTLVKYDQKPDENTKMCDICKVISRVLFALLDKVCSTTDKNGSNSEYEELCFYVCLSYIFDEIIGGCDKCDRELDHIMSLRFALEFLRDKDINKLQRSVFSWKSAENSDNIIAGSNKIRKHKEFSLEKADIDDHITVYLDFNVYDQYEKDPAIANYFNKLSNHDNIDIICSLTHAEELLRMNDEKYENLRRESIITLTKGKIAAPDENQKLSFRIGNIDELLDYSKQYRDINRYAEDRECIIASERSRLPICLEDENRQKAVGNSSFQEIINNVNKDTGEKINPDLPDANELDHLIHCVGIGDTIEEYKDMLKDGDHDFHQTRTAIVSLAELMNIIGLHGDKIVKKGDMNAGYSGFDQKNFRTVKSGFYDNDHLSLASKCTYFVTADKTLCKKAKAIYDFLGIKTIPVLLKDFINRLDP